MNKICTSIEQSKHLLELGLDPKTADMSYYEAIIGDYYPQVGKEYKDDIPAWSLSALLDLIPSDGPFGIVLDNYSKKIKNLWTVTYNTYPVEFSPTQAAPDLIDAVCEIIIWLLENKKL